MVSDMLPCGVAVGTTAVEVAVVVVPVGVVPVTVAVLVTEPPVCCVLVIEYGPETVHVIEAPGARVEEGQLIVTLPPLSRGSVRVTLLSVVFPELVTTKE